jgi:hypothetical protein
MAYVPANDDPFSGGEKVPSLSWNKLPHGSVFTLEILEPAKKLQERDFNTGKPKFWDDDRTQPVHAAVINVLVKTGPHSVGELRSIWATIPSNMYIALKDAQKQAGAPFSPGGTLRIRLKGEEPHRDPNKHAIKQYEAKYEPPAAGTDVWGETPATPAAQPATPSKAW